ncbi:MAG TPA: zf-TFIIB domain-containing protein [Noviherbaspirillum sp.]|nr:zf-TFIIB domain-containing protein [Noviherbaspirillum sp.]
MQCPVCKTVNLTMSERQGIEIDYCPQCRGVWLDRGELDKIIERSQPSAQPVPPVQPQGQAAPPPQPGYDPRHDPRHDPRYDPRHGGYYKKKKREGFLSDLFDFD